MASVQASSLLTAYIIYEKKILVMNLPFSAGVRVRLRKRTSLTAVDGGVFARSLWA